MEKLKIEYVDIDSIKPYKNNAKLHPAEQIEQIKKSIEQFGMDDPIGIWKDEIVEGHGRLIACKELGMKEIPIIRLDHLTDEERKAYTLAHNKLTMNSDFDLDILNDELMNSFDTIDMSEFGFDIDLDIEEEQEIVEDEVPEVPEEPKAKLGDIYQLGSHRLMCGDSTSEEDVAKLMNGVKADMLFTDPPYGINYSADKMNLKNSSHFEVIKNDDKDVEKLIKCCFNFNCIKVIWGANNFFKYLPHKGVWYAWDKRSDGLDDENIADNVIGSQFELAWLDKQNGYQKIFRIKHGGFLNADGGKRIHPTQKPTKLIIDILESEKAKENILDLFGGSGSTLIACEKTNRKCYMMELDPHYIDVIIQRWENFTGQKAVKIEGE